MRSEDRSGTFFGVKFVHAADLHLDSPLCGIERYEGAPVEKMRGATRRALANLVDLAIAEDAKLVLVAGDVYDGGWKDYNTGLFFAKEMARLGAAGIRVVLIRGNHDAASQITKSLRLPGNVRQLAHEKPETVELADLGIAVHGQSFATRAVTDDLSQNYPLAVPGLFNIGLLHTCVDGREGHEPYAPCKLETLRSKGYDYWALGHVHKREVLGERPWIVFPGNLQGRHVRELGAKGATLVTVESGRVASVEHRAVDVVRWAVCEVDVTEARDAAEAVELAGRALARAAEQAEGRPVAARVTFHGATRAHAALEAEWERTTNEVRAAAIEVGGEGVWVEKVVLATRTASDLASLRKRDDGVGELVRALDLARADDAVLALLADDLKDLGRRLPLELREGEDALRLDDPRWLREELDAVEATLVPRLLERRAGERGEQER